MIIDWLLPRMKFIWHININGCIFGNLCFFLFAMKTPNLMDYKGNCKYTITALLITTYTSPTYKIFT